MDAEAIIGAVHAVTKKWTKQRRSEEREASREYRRREALTRTYRVTIKEVAEEVMEAAYLKASSGGTLPAHARQIMYAARGEIQRRTGRRLDDQYFIQTLLVDYLNENPDKAEEWDIVFDARGHFEEPYTGRIVPLGTIDVREYLEKVREHEGGEEDLKVSLPDPGSFPTVGPRGRFAAVLFIEKEGFLPLFRAVKLAERYDLAVMSTKGMSVTASRLLIDELSSGGSGIPILVLHDFDKAGFSILGTLQRDTRRYEFQNQVEVIDLGLRLDDVKAHGLEAEDVSYGRVDPTWNLSENGATREEIAFLIGEGAARGRRVELNAFSSGDFIQWIERKLKGHGVRKVVPDEDTLDAAYRRALEIKLLGGELKKAQADLHRLVKVAKPPRGLLARVKSSLRRDPELSWDEAVAREVEGARVTGRDDAKPARLVPRQQKKRPPLKGRK